MGQLIANKFKIGDIVQLASGGPAMTILRIDGNETSVVWFVGDDKIEGADLHQDTLVKL